MPRMSKRGFTLIELAASLGILSLLVTGTIYLISLELDTARQSETIAKVTMLKRAMVGDPRIVTKESRTDFGYVGDMGSLPPALTDLWVRGAKPAFTFDNAKKTGAGWAGPYIPVVGPLENSAALVLDAWGNGITYSIGIGTSATTGQQYQARIISPGPDAAVGNADDLTAEIYTTEMHSTVVSYIRDSSGNPMPNITVKMNYPVDGALTTTEVLSGVDGSYQFTGVPLGNRSITVEPKLVYSEGSGVSLGGGGDDVEFVMISFTCGTITGATVTLGDAPTPFFQQFIVGGTTVFNSTTNLAGEPGTGSFAGDDDPIDFSTDRDISWSGCGGGGVGISTVFPVRVQSPFTQVPDQDIGAGASAGKSFRMRMNNFKENENNSGASVDMTGVSISVTFAPINAVAIFSPVPN
jgi:prepilin-type N-terminal cleavage/methylation domain-containing protein